VQYERILELLTSGSVTADLYDGRQGDRSGGTNEEEGPMDGSVAWEGPSGSEFDDPWLYGDSSGNDEDVDIMHQANRVASLGLESDSSNGHRRQLLKGDDRDMVSARWLLLTILKYLDSSSRLQINPVDRLIVDQFTFLASHRTLHILIYFFRWLYNYRW